MSQHFCKRWMRILDCCLEKSFQELFLYCAQCICVMPRAYLMDWFLEIHLKNCVHNLRPYLFHVPLVETISFLMVPGKLINVGKFKSETCLTLK